MPDITFKHGLIPNNPHRARLYFKTFRNPEASAPASVNYSNFPSPGMLGNDNYGDCVEAGNGHVVMQQTFIGQGTEASITTEEVLAEYTRITGFNPNDPDTDQGTELQAGLDDFRKNGVNGHKIAGFAQLDPSNLDDVKLAVSEFGAVSIGFEFPASAMNQFNQGQPWTFVNGSPIEGGHCVIVMGYDSDWLYVLTWGAVQKMGYDFWNAYVAGRGGEAWVVIDEEWVNTASGKDIEGVDKYAFGAQFAALTGQANPFPEPAPTPTPAPSPTPTPSPVPTPSPSPTPEPTPVPDDPSEDALVVATHRALRAHDVKPAYLARALKTWLTAEDL
jgi:hypothetical protein